MENNTLDNRHIQVENAQAMTRLLENEDFKKVFQDLYIDAYAITNVYNLWSYDDAGRRRFLEKSMARSYFSRFIDEILEDGRVAKDDLDSEQD